MKRRGAAPGVEGPTSRARRPPATSALAHGAPPFPQDADPERWSILALLAVAELLGMSLWFAGSAAAPQLRERWLLSGEQVGWLTSAVQLGFVAGTAISAALNLADVIPARRLFASAAFLGAVANAWLAVARGLPDAFASRFLAGACLAGVYPPAMKMASTWFRARRGLAVGTIVGALTVGKAGPYLIGAMPEASVAFITLFASASAALAAALVTAAYRDGPYPFLSRPFSWGLVATVFGAQRWRLATGG